MKATMINSFLLAVLSTSVFVAAVPQPSATSSSASSLPSIVEANPSNDVEEQDEQQNMQQVTCKDYLSLGHTSESLAPCQPYCGNAVDTANGNVSSVTCLSGGLNIPTYSDSNGQYVMGVCRCNIGLLDQIVDDVIMALPAIADIGCEILVDAFELVVKVGAAAIPGADEVDAADAGMQGLVKAGGAIKKGGKGADALLNWLDPCGQNQFTSSVDAVFDDLTLGIEGSGGTGNIASDAAGASISSTTASSTATQAPATTTTAASSPSTTAVSTTSSATASSSGALNPFSFLEAAIKSAEMAKSSTTAKARRAVTTRA